MHRALLALALLLVAGIPAARADDCSGQAYTTLPLEPVGTYYLDGTFPLGPAGTYYVHEGTIYQETNGHAGLQRGDGTCEGEADTALI